MVVAPSLSPLVVSSESPRIRVLLVDDDTDIIGLTERLLRSSGYEVVSLCSSEAALELFSADPDQFDVVITDHHMPGLSGARLAEQLHRVRPELPIILCSGSLAGGALDAAEAAGITEFLSKPLSLASLTTAVARALHVS